MEGSPSRDEVIELLSALVAINSINPGLVPGAPGEGEIATFIAAWLRDAGLEVELQEAAPGRPNVIGSLPGRGYGRSLMLNAHVDTVGVEGYAEPHAPRVEGDRLYGRGSFDMKAGLAAIMLAARSVAQAGRAAGDLVVTAVTDEEYTSAGTEAVAATITTNAAVVAEPTDLNVCVAHKGFAWYAIETAGRAAHGSRPDLGVDAIAHMGRVLNDLEHLQAELSERPPHPLLGTASVHASLIEGGQELSSYPASCRLQVERRTLPGETPDQVTEEIQASLRRRAAHDAEFSAQAELLFWRDPFEVSAEAEIAQVIRETVTRVLGREPQVEGHTPWMDAAILSAAGIPTVVFGPGGDGAHSVREWASIESVARCAQILAETAMKFCEASSSR